MKEEEGVRIENQRLCYRIHNETQFLGIRLFIVWVWFLYRYIWALFCYVSFDKCTELSVAIQLNWNIRMSLNLH